MFLTVFKLSQNQTSDRPILFQGNAARAIQTVKFQILIWALSTVADLTGSAF